MEGARCMQKRWLVAEMHGSSTHAGSLKPAIRACGHDTGCGAWDVGHIRDAAEE